ncbi:ABC transporter permease [Ferrovibrio sp.]|uniref:ABC transporter permease n=1 Tax=Ferrovibrio sp. TaxID=1917215 RepID=UPI001B3E2D8D|nr:ABC transporter permease [Ferrovibrio sp.]MBP7063449.1 ABC transporter permease [Ferrovibrio sp.]
MQPPANAQPSPPPAAAPNLAPRDYGLVNWLGLWTLYLKEVQRFLKVITQTVLAPVVTTLLFFAVFALALGGAVRQVGGLPFIDFLAPGLIMMATTQNAFANTSSSLMISKIQGNIVDVLMPPLSPGELLVAYALAGVTRGMVVASAVGVAMLPFISTPIQAWWAVVYYALLGSLILSLIGILAGLWSQKFDHLAAVTNFVITPLAFLSGTFYSVQQLPPFWYAAAHANPFFFMIDGFRYGMTGHTDGDITLGATALGLVALALWGFCHLLLKRGYRLRP